MADPDGVDLPQDTVGVDRPLQKYEDAHGCPPARSARLAVFDRFGLTLRTCVLLQRALAVAIIAAAPVSVLAVVVGVTGGVEDTCMPAGERQHHWKEQVLMEIVAESVALVLIVLPLAYVVATACTAYLRWLAFYATILYYRLWICTVLVGLFVLRGYCIPAVQVVSVLTLVIEVATVALVLERVVRLANSLWSELGVGRVIGLFVASLVAAGVAPFFYGEDGGVLHTCLIALWALLNVSALASLACMYNGVLRDLKGVAHKTPSPQVAADAWVAVSFCRANLAASVLCIASTVLCHTVDYLWKGIWPIPSLDELSAGSPRRTAISVLRYSWWALDKLALFLSVSIFSGTFTGALKPSLAKQDEDISCRALRTQQSQLYQANGDADWQQKVEDLAGRGFSLAALLKFYRGLGHEYMLHFNGSQSTTNDVVRRAIIPLSRDARCPLATVMMDGVPTRPRAMVTHNWGNLFRDLVAAIVADALGDSTYDYAAWQLDTDMDLLEAKVKKAGTMENTYWVCAFSVSQHDGICGGNPYGDTDKVLAEVHPICPCGKPKFFNDTAPLRGDGKSIGCEMNKFDDMMAYLASTDRRCVQVIAVDREFVVFSRAWCVAELAMASNFGMSQRLKIASKSSLRSHEESLRGLRIEEMSASRPEDIAEILEDIPDTESFNQRMQALIFKVMLKEWKGLDLGKKMREVGRLLRQENITEAC